MVVAEKSQHVAHMFIRCYIISDGCYGFSMRGNAVAFSISDYQIKQMKSCESRMNESLARFCYREKCTLELCYVPTVISDLSQKAQEHYSCAGFTTVLNFMDLLQKHSLWKWTKCSIIIMVITRRGRKRRLWRIVCWLCQGDSNVHQRPMWNEWQELTVIRGLLFNEERSVSSQFLHLHRCTRHAANLSMLHNVIKLFHKRKGEALTSCWSYSDNTRLFQWETCHVLLCHWSFIIINVCCIYFSSKANILWNHSLCRSVCVSTVQCDHTELSDIFLICY